MSIVEGYPELNYYATMDGFTPSLPDALKTEKEQRSLFALETQLQKTKLCRYHMKGLCKHGSDCRFAHGKDELVQPPNLQKTRMCPDFLANGVCNNPNCTFAHHESELKKVNICHKTAVCTWFLAGKCRNGEECDFAHGEHELKGNAAAVTVANTRKQPVQMEQQERMPLTADNSGYQRKEPMFIQSSMTPAASVPPPYEAPENTQWSHADQFQPQMHFPVVPPPPPPPGFMPTYMPGMQPCLAMQPGYPAAPQQDPTAFNYMGMQPPPLMPQYPGVEPVRNLPPGLPVGTVLVPNATSVSPELLQNELTGLSKVVAQTNPSQKSWQLTELAVQINMLSEEVKRLQDFVIPRSVQSTNSGNSGSSTRSSSGDNRTPRAGGNDGSPGTVASGSTPGSTGSGSSSSNGVPNLDNCRSFEEKVAHLQKELKRVMDEGQRCGKIRQTVVATM